jgi:SpoVK/Ycf46/Vps4 family AAA+-type ATPase
MPYCQHCGAKVEYCPSCGQPLAAIAPATQTPPVEQPEPEVYEEVVLWEGKPGAKAGRKAITQTYRITTERVQVIHSGLSRKTEEIELSRLKDVKVQQSLAQRALKTGNVTILSTDKTTPSVTFQEVSGPEDVKELVRKAAREEMERLKVRRFTDA